MSALQAAGPRGLTPASAAKVAEQAARACLIAPRHIEEGVTLLCELALAKDPVFSRIGSDGIFRQVVEPAADAFEPRLADLYIEFFTSVIQFARGVLGDVDRQLRRYGLLSDEKLVERARRVQKVVRFERRGVRKALILSRVTLGADIAVTSVLLRRLMRAFPEAEICLVGSPKAGQLFSGEPRIRLAPLEYPRSGGLEARLGAWVRLAEAVAAETDGLSGTEYVVVDPDSRFTQLGILPATDDERSYRFFPSRSFDPATGGSLAELAAAWVQEVFGPDPEPLLPWVSLPADLVQNARRQAGSGRWAAVNLGVGDNPRKRLGDAFEERLLLGLRAAGWNLFVDVGDGPEETARVEALLARLGDGPQVLAHRGSLAGFGACIAASGLYVGYDSAGQHLAAALGVPAIDIFAGHASPKMVERWRPTGRGPITMVVVDARDSDPDTVLARVLEAAR